MGVSENRGPLIVGSLLLGPQNKVPPNFRKLPYKYTEVWTISGHEAELGWGPESLKAYSGVQYCELERHGLRMIIAGVRVMMFQFYSFYFQAVEVPVASPVRVPLILMRPSTTLHAS